MRAALLAMMMAAPVAAQDWSGTGPQVLSPDWPEGAYVSGWFESAAPARLSLEGGAAPRPLGGDAGRRAVLFVMPAGGTLRIATDAATDWSLHTDRVVPKAEQGPVPDDPSPRIADARTDPEAFWRQITAEGTPMVEYLADRTVLTFLYRGAHHGVTIFGAPEGDHGRMERLGDTDIWFRSYEVPSDTRLSYQLAPDVPQIPGTARERRVALLATLGPDPLNRHFWDDGALGSSTVTLRDAPLQPGFPVMKDPAPQVLSWASGRLGNTRRVWLHRTAGFDPATGRVLVMFDGPTAIGPMGTPGMLDNLVAQGRLPPFAAVFVDPVDSATRTRELPGSADFADALADELLPQIWDVLGGRVPPARVVVAGQSFGGIGAMNAAVSHPEAFGNVISMSGSYWWGPEGTESDTNWMADRILAVPALPIRAVIAAGRFEYSADGGGDIRESSRLLYAAMRAKGYDVGWTLFSGGHDSFAWRGVLGQGLVRLFGP